ncbi:MAG TPA: NlpC/P60 family protein [Acidimicrobiales bacterium]|nr:NlpC/P60 family protein [Acidimicrobiales bacterium]
MSLLAERLDESRLNQDQLNQQLARAKADLAQTDQQVAAQLSRLRAQAVNAYVSDGSASMAQLVVQGDQEEAGLRRNYLETVTGQAHEAIDSLRASRMTLDQKRAELTRAQDAARAAVNHVASAERDAAAADAAERTTLAKVQGELATLVAQEQQRQAAAQAARMQAQVAARLAAIRADSSAAPSSDPGPGGSGGASAAVEEAKRQLGKPYHYGGTGPNSFDCSGLTAWAWRAGGRSLPHSASSQYSVTTHIPVNALQPGDLVFYGSPPHHVGIYVGGGQMIDALHSGTRVEYDSIYVEGDLIGGGRVN